jgi:uncharacterized protein YjbI with pentapeptide repeats
MKREKAQHTEGRIFEKSAFGKKNMPEGVYEECRFRHCSFSGADLSGVTFRSCVFENCDMTLAKVEGTAFQEVRFEGCKLLGVAFSECRPLFLEMAFLDCMLKLSRFNGLGLKKTVFSNCDMEEADFTGADLTGSLFDNSNLMRTLFEHTCLEQADFRTAGNYSINPETNRLRKARFSLAGVPGLLDRYGIRIE